MAYTRIFTDESGETHFEEVDLDWTETQPGIRVAHGIPAQCVRFRWTPGSEYFSDWHNAPQPQFAITVTGRVEVTVSDGERREFGPGEVMLFEDLTGKGHITRGVGDEERLTAFVPLLPPE